MISNIKLNDSGGLFNKWTFFLGGIMLFSVGGVLVAGKYNNNETDEFDEDELKPENFKIID